MFYEKKALSLQNLQTSLAKNSDAINTQMNLGEFLAKVKHCHIETDPPMAQKQVLLQSQLNWDAPVIRINQLAAIGILEETIQLINKCKHYESELEKRDNIIQ